MLVHCVYVGVARNSLLVNALADILCQAAQSNVVVCDISHESLSSSLPNNADFAPSTSPAVNNEPTVNAQLDTHVHNELSTTLSSTEAGCSETAVKRQRLGHEQFHNSLR